MRRAAGLSEAHRLRRTGWTGWSGSRPRRPGSPTTSPSGRQSTWSPSRIPDRPESCSSASASRELTADNRPWCERSGAVRIAWQVGVSPSPLGAGRGRHAAGGRRAGHPRRVHRSWAWRCSRCAAPTLTNHRHGGTRCNSYRLQAASFDRHGASSSGPGGRATVGRRARSTGAPRPAGSSRTELTFPSSIHPPGAAGARPPRHARRRLPTDHPGTSGVHHVQEVGDMTWLIILALLLALDLVAWRWGHDSRDGRDWRS
jgi:hypothetical protein